MAVTFRVGDTFAVSNTTIDVSADPSTDDILIVPLAESDTAGGGPLNSSWATIGTGYGGTWVQEHNQLWGSRRRLNVWVNDDFTTVAGTATVTYVSNQDKAGGCLVVEGATKGAAYENAQAGNASGTNWTPTLTAGSSGDGHVVIIQMEDTVTISTPSGWTKHAQVTATGGMRSLAVYSAVGTLADTTPTFSWSGTNGYTAWAGLFPAAAGGATAVTGTPTTSATVSDTGVVTATATVVGTPTTSASVSDTGVITATATVVGTPTTSSSVSDTATITATATVAGAATTSASVSDTASITATATVVGSPTTSASVSDTANVGATLTTAVTGTATVSATVSDTATVTATATVVGTPTTSASVSDTAAITATATVVGSPTTSASVSDTANVGATATTTVTGTATVSATISDTGVITATATVTGTPTTSATVSATASINLASSAIVGAVTVTAAYLGADRVDAMYLGDTQIL
jgi:hypothetical protein